MKHFSDEAWVDFVRGVAAADQHHQMVAHLQSNCLSCRESINWLQQIQRVGTQEPVPLPVVQAARGIFPQAVRWNDWAAKLPALAAHVVFSAGLDWQPSGVRSAAPQLAPSDQGGRLVFDAGEYRIHVKIQSPTANEPGEIVGEITNRESPAENLEGVLIQAIASGRTVRETTSNRFGEFVMDYPFIEETTLRLALRDRGVRIDLTLETEESRQF